MRLPAGLRPSLRAPRVARVALAACATLAACGGPSKPAPATPPAPPAARVAPAADGASCQQAVDALFAVTAAAEAPDIKARSAKVFVDRCEADRWSAEIRGCLAGVKAPDDADRCEALLTPAQRTELRDQLARELDAAGVRPEVESGRPDGAKPGAPPPQPAVAPAATDKKKSEPSTKKSAPAPKGTSRRTDPCEGGE